MIIDAISTSSAVLKFSKANSKLKKLANVDGLKDYLANGRKVYSFDLLSGWSCPGAKDCLSKVYEIDGRKKLKDGADCRFRCFSASEEVSYPNVYKARKNNFDIVRQLSTNELLELFSDQLPKDLGIMRWHVAGDLFSWDYFQVACKIAAWNPDRLFYAYTKSLHFYARALGIGIIPKNFRITASVGGKFDALIDEFKLPYALVVNHEEEAKALGLEIDTDDSSAALGVKAFALLIHGVQPKGSVAADAIKRLKKEGIDFSYSNKKKS